MANFVSGYSGSQLDAILSLFVNKGLNNVTGIIKRKSDGTFEAASASDGTVTSVGLTNGGGLTITGSPVTSSGNITVGHSNSVTAQTTAKLYPIKFDQYGHITGIGSEVTSLPASDVSSWAKAESKPSYTYSEIGSKPTTVSGFGITDVYTKTEVDGKISGVLHYKGTKATVADVTALTGMAVGDVWHVTANGAEYAYDGSTWQELGTATDLSGYVPTSRTINSKALTGNITLSAATETTGITIANHTTTSITGVSGSTSVYGVKSGTNSTTTASKASGSNGSAPTLGTAITVYSKSSGGNGTAPTLTFGIDSSDSTQLNITWSAGSASNWAFESKSIPNVTSVGSASTWSFSDVTVPIRADSATTVPTAASAVTVVTEASHNITDNGHTHTIS